MSSKADILIDSAKKLKRYRALNPILYLAKKHIYNRYLRSRLIVSEFPPEVWIENTNACNAHCIMCPRDSLTRKRGFMDLSLYEKLIKEISKFNEIVKRVHLHNYGEPLLDKDLVSRIKLAKNYGIKHTYFVTNASLLTPDKSREIIEAGLDEFKISFYGTDTETYNRTMRGLNFEKTLQNIKEFSRIREEMNEASPKVVIQYLPLETNKSKTEEFFKLMKPLINEKIGDILYQFSLHNYGGGRSYIKTGGITNICNYPWRTMVILQDGKVVLCCLDYNGVQVVGDVNKNTIQEIWNGERYRKVREDFKKMQYKDYPVCMKCDIIRWKIGSSA